ncbi:MAG: hypothetical protein K8I03_10255, partial [Ignavibacteria bacterium]|nr:hypothetical protein [Ignavibacteria bacterium]
MKTILILLLCLTSFSQEALPPQQIFMQGNNINTCFRTNGIFNYDFVTFPSPDAGMSWPVTSPNRKTINFASGIVIGAKVGPQRELRVAGSMYASHYTSGNIPVIGQIPPSSVCNDPLWRAYLVNLTDPALSGGGERLKIAGGRQYTLTYDSWTNWPVDKGAPFVEVNGIPGYQPAWNGDRPGIGNGSSARPDELSFMVFMDYTNCTNNIHQSQTSLPGGTLPLGVEIQQLAFMFNCPPLQDMYFMKWKVINKSSLQWDSAFFSVLNDPDIGDGGCGASDDDGGVDTLRDMVFAYNGDNNDCNYGSNPPSIGYRYLQSPIRQTANPMDTAKLPYDTLPGFKILGLTSNFLIVNGSGNICLTDPHLAQEGFNVMRGLDACGNAKINPISGLPTMFNKDGNACTRTGWYDSIPKNMRDWSNSGPFVMNSGDTQIVVMSFMVTRDGGNNFQNVCALQSLSDSALKYYYNDFRLCVPIGIQPIST